jgi:hypothetical protein
MILSRGAHRVEQRMSEVTRGPTRIQPPGPPRLGPPDSYFHGIWIAATENEPVEWYDELDASRWSIRCVRKYRDGRLKAYSYTTDNWQDVMPEAPIPPIADINRDSDFSAREISKAEPRVERRSRKLLNKIDDLCAERDRLKAAQPPKALRARRRGEVVR